MGMPGISIPFTEKAASLVKRGERGIIAMILKDENTLESKTVVCSSSADVPETLSSESQEQIKLALMGYVNTPLRVIAYPITEDSEYADALNYFKTVKFDYLVAPSAATDNKTADIVSYVKAERQNKKYIKAILPNVSGNSEGIINFATEKVMVNDKEYDTEKYCSRIAGIIAGTPLSMSCTYAPLTELTDCSRLTLGEMDAAVDAGKFIVWFDGEKVKTGRGINSLTTLTAEKNTQFQKIKIVDAMDMITDDIRKTAEDNYIGKYANTYDNKCLLIAAIGNYFEQLKMDNVIQSYEVGISISENKNYLKGKGIDVESMSDDEIKVANTGSFVYLEGKLSMLDAIEDIKLPISI